MFQTETPVTRSRAPVRKESGSKQNLGDALARSPAPPYSTKLLGRLGCHAPSSGGSRPAGGSPCLLFSIIKKSQGEGNKLIVSFYFLRNTWDPIQDPTGSAVTPCDELCFSLGFGAFYATGSDGIRAGSDGIRGGAIS